MITSYDIIDNIDDIVGGGSNANRWASNQPAGWIAEHDGSGWRLSFNTEIVGYCGNMEEVKEAIRDRHNQNARGLEKSAVSWVKYYHKHPDQKRLVDPDVLASIEGAAERHKEKK